MSNEQPVENLMRSTMENLRDMIDANTVPRNNPEENSYPFGGGAGSGVSVKPITFLVIKDDMVRMMPIEHDNTYDRIADNIPQVLDMIKNLIKDISSNKNKKSDCYDSIKKDDLSDTCSNND